MESTRARAEGWTLRAVGIAARAILVASLLILAAGLPAFSAAAKDRDKAKGTGSFSERNLKKIQKMYALQEAGDIPAAKAILESINVDREKPYGRSKIYQFLGSFAQQEEQYDKAIDFLDKSVEADGLTLDEENRTMFQVGMLQVKMERYDDAIATFEKWMKVIEAPTAQSYYMLAVTYFQAQRAEEALVPAKKAVELASEPQEAWYRLLLALYLNEEKYDEGIELLDEIILQFPNNVYWTQLAALYNQKEQMDKSLAVQQLAQYEGYITEERDLIRMAQMFMVQGLPHRGAAIMKKGLEDGSMKPAKSAYQTYADTLLQSREWEQALDPIAKAAALTDDGSMWVRHAQVNLQLGRWSDARDSLNQAFQKGKIPDEGQAHILFGIAAANDKQWDAATSSFRRAANYPGTADVAIKWMGFVDREKMRFATPEEQAKMAAERAAAEAAAGGGEAEKKTDDAKKAAGTATQSSADSKAPAQASSKN